MLTFIWIPSHCNILGKEKVDKAAKNTSTIPHPSFAYCPTPTDFKPVLCSQMLIHWHALWKSQLCNKHLLMKHTPSSSSRANCREVNTFCSTTHRSQGTYSLPPPFLFFLLIFPYANLQHLFTQYPFPLLLSLFQFL